MFVKKRDEPCEVEQRSTETIDLVDDHAINPTSANIVKQLAERRTIHRSAREPAVVVAISQALPSLVALGFDVGRTRLALGVQ